MAKLTNCKDCNHEVSERAKSCPNCGVSWPGRPGHGRYGPWLIVLAVAVMGFLAALYARYETITPCGMLRAEIKRYALTEALGDGGIGDGFEALGTAIGLSMVDNMVEAVTASYGPIQCASALIRAQSHGGLQALLNDGYVPRPLRQPDPPTPPTEPPPAALSMSAYELRSVPNPQLCEAYHADPLNRSVSGELLRRGRFNEEHWAAIRSNTLFAGMLSEGLICSFGYPNRGYGSGTWVYDDSPEGPLRVSIQAGRVADWSPTE